MLSTVAGASGLVIAATFVLGATLCSLVAVLVALGGTLGAVLTFLAFFTVVSCMATLAAAGSMAACAAFGEPSPEDARQGSQVACTDHVVHMFQG